MHRVLLALIVVAFATAAAAEPFEGLKPGMPVAEVRRILGPGASQDPFSTGYALVVSRPDGRILSVDVCTKGGGETVVGVAEQFGTTLAAFATEVAEAKGRLGEPQWTVTIPPKTSGASALLMATWQTPDGPLIVGVIQVGGSMGVYRDLRRPCG